jgi:hypothetical protein
MRIEDGMNTEVYTTIKWPDNISWSIDTYITTTDTIWYINNNSDKTLYFIDENNNKCGVNGIQIKDELDELFEREL